MTYVKLHRSVVDHEMLARDNNAYIVFTKLLARVNWRTGSITTGRFKLATLFNVNPNTLYGVLKRLESSNMIQQQVNRNSTTTITVINWGKYQQDDGQLNNKSNETQTKLNTINNNKKLITNNTTKSNINVEVSKETRLVYELFLERFNKNPNQYKLTDSRKSKIKSRLKDAGLKMLQAAIVNTSNDSFYSGDNDRNWKADLDFIIRSYEQVEKLSQIVPKQPASKTGFIPPPRKEYIEISDEDRAKASKRVEQIRKDLAAKKSLHP